ncbi:MAG: hypothetical protein ACXV5F_02625 [Halobacteriota archaeon]
MTKSNEATTRRRTAARHPTPQGQSSAEALDMGAFFVGALWIITFPVSTALLALFFKRLGATKDSS